MSPRFERPECRALRVSGLDRATLDVPTGLLIVTRGGHSLIGSPAELRALARILIRACDEAERPALPARTDFLDTLEAEGIHPNRALH